MCKHSGSKEEATHYTKHLVLLWKSVCSARGLSGLLGAANRRMLSLAERPPSTPFVTGIEAVVEELGGAPVTGTAEGMFLSWSRERKDFYAATERMVSLWIVKSFSMSGTR